MKNLINLFLLILGLNTLTHAQTVTIGTQVWMTKNLDVSTFRNGDPIPEAKTNEDWNKAREEGKPAWCYYDNNPGNGSKYGKLYNWSAVIDSRGLAPDGYHIPSDDEWTKLTDFLGGEKVAGIKMRSEPIYETKIRYVEEGGYDETKWVRCDNCSYWTEKQKSNNPCTVCRNQGGKTIKTGKYIPKTKRKIEDIINISGWNGTNESGFSGFPGGLRDYGGTFQFIENYGWWWSSTEDETILAWIRVLVYNYDVVNRKSYAKHYGFSVRCLRD